jgi:hypothetical protein
MKLKDAIEKAINGSKITRKLWANDYYFQYVNNEIKAFANIISNYIYTESIMNSDGWILDNGETDRKFHEIIIPLRRGIGARLPHWENSFIFYDAPTGDLLIKTVGESHFAPDFASFSADDWMVIE